MARRTVLALGLVVLLAAGAVLAAPADAASKRQRLEQRAKRTVGAALTRGGLTEQRIRCRAARGARRARCSWRALRRLSPNRAKHCRGRYRVRRRGRRVRLRRLSRRCELRVAAVDPLFGFNDNSVVRKQVSAATVARLAEGTGAGIVRMTVDWRAAEPSRDNYRLAAFDATYAALLERGLRPIVVLMWAPSWAWEPLTLCGGDCHLPPGRAFDGEWRQMAALLARRYPRAAGIEIWNEPNESFFWQPRADPARYADLLAQAHDAIHAANPAMRVIGGGANARAASDGSNMSLADFTRSIYSRGAAGHMEALGYHPYVRQLEPRRLNAVTDLVRSIRDAAGDSATPLWATELGLTTSGSADTRFFSDAAAQATRLVEAYRTLRRRSEVGAVVVHALIDPRDDADDFESGFGVLRRDLSAKPAYCALARAVGVRGRCP